MLYKGEYGEKECVIMELKNFPANCMACLRKLANYLLIKLTC